MSGIFGIIQRDGRPVDPGRLEAMRDAMAHRGPDGSKLWINGPAGLGQLMLHSTPESLHETLPWEDPDSGLVITADARIDNREDLIRALAPEARKWSSAVSDSRLILESFKCRGEACVEQLLGDFVFTVWDRRTQKLFCARDHMGLRHFHYFCCADVFVFATSALGVAASGLTPRNFNPARVADALVPGMEGADKVSSFFQDVWRCPPAHLLRLSGSGCETSRYWQPDPDKERRFESDEACTEAFTEVLDASVQSRLRSNKPVASMLSGGLDSATIVGLARDRLTREGKEPLATYSGLPDAGRDCRESRYCQMVIDQGGVQPGIFRPSDISACLARLEAAENRLEEPFEAGWILHRMIFMQAREAGHAAIMNGIDGDGVASLTTGYPAFLMRRGHFADAHREITGMWRHYHRQTIPLWDIYQRNLRAALIPEWGRRLKRKVVPARGAWLDEDCFLSAGLTDKSDLERRSLNYLEHCNLRTARTLREAHARRMAVPYLATAIERYDRMAAACGVEARAPLLDRRVVEFCVSLPWQHKVRGGWSKYGMRRVAERILPGQLAWRTGWDSVLASYWKAWGGLSLARLSEVARDISETQQPWVDGEKFKASANRYKMVSHDVQVSLWKTSHLVNWRNRIEREYGKYE